MGVNVTPEGASGTLIKGIAFTSGDSALSTEFPPVPFTAVTT
jgi:hypothetical protein